jgi:hypothetical protein
MLNNWGYNLQCLSSKGLLLNPKGMVILDYVTKAATVIKAATHGNI